MPEAAHTDGWEFWIDRGGTFTDIVARRPDGGLETLKLLSENPDHYEDAAVAGVRQLLAGGARESEIRAVKMGTTVATNALLERRGEPTVLVITAGLRDAIRIGSQQRPDLFALDIELPEVLYADTVEAHERLAADGATVMPLDEARLERDLRAARARGFASAAIVLLHGYRHPRHEQRAAAVARAAGFEQVSVSHEVSPLIKLVERGGTTLVDAYLSPVLSRYVASVRRGLGGRLGGAPLLFMQSHGGLADAERFRGKDSVLSGPAGGVVGMAAAARGAGLERVVGFDMGGTSTDVSLFDGAFERSADNLVAGIRITAPMMRIHTVAAGGGSILKIEASRLQVGPESAGAFPGPACYRNGGPLTVTDANVLLGRIQPDFFPAVFGPGARSPIDAATVRERFAALAEEQARTTDKPLDPDVLAGGFLRIAVERMAHAIKQISIQRGHDVTQFGLVCFGGAGGQHACRVADALGIDTVLIPALAGVLSAYGMGVADLRALRQQAVERELDADCVAALEALYERLGAQAADALREQRVEAERVSLQCRLGVKLRGSDTALELAWHPGRDAQAVAQDYARAHAAHFGFDPEDAPILVVESVEIEAVGTSPKHDEPLWPERPGPPERAAVRRIAFADGWHETPVYRREGLGRGVRIAGPALVVEPNSTTVIECDWQADVGSAGQLVLSRARARRTHESVARERDPIMLEVFNNLFMHVAEQMGAVLANTAHSVNIKERLDFSCAIFDAAGELVANAPHVPVHLGSMGDSVRAILEANAARISAGDVFMLNAPYRGGTHLPDITVVTPVFGADANLRFVVASRAHHADVGGVSPGSMPAASRSIEEEGVLLDNMKIVHGGRFLDSAIRAALADHEHPARNPDQNIADLKAQIAANAKGIAELEAMVERFGLDVVHAYMAHIKRNAEECVRAAIDGLDDGRWSLELDGGERIAVAVRVDRQARGATVDFAGTSAMSPRNFNAPAAIARAVVLYVFRTLVRQDIPLNAGCLKPLAIRLPEKSLVAPEYPAAVVAGNVETSQCIADALLAALGACAASQGTMNNLTFGNARYQYYETLCGGAGAGPGFAGASAVHTHMTNSRLTDVEVLEWRFPVRVRRFEIRAGSGGAGAFSGGDGIVRELEFLEPMRGGILSNRRRVAPFGLAGGEDAARGANRVIRRSGEVEEQPACVELELAAGDRLVIETPGGGGYGASDRS